MVIIDPADESEKPAMITEAAQSALNSRRDMLATITRLERDLADTRNELARMCERVDQHEAEREAFLTLYQAASDLHAALHVDTNGSVHSAQQGYSAAAAMCRLENALTVVEEVGAVE